MSVFLKCSVQFSFWCPSKMNNELSLSLRQMMSSLLDGLTLPSSHTMSPIDFTHPNAVSCPPLVNTKPRASIHSAMLVYDTALMGFTVTMWLKICCVSALLPCTPGCQLSHIKFDTQIQIERDLKSFLMLTFYLAFL